MRVASFEVALEDDADSDARPGALRALRPVRDSVRVAAHGELFGHDVRELRDLAHAPPPRWISS
jgi:hypothetical protein